MPETGLTHFDAGGAAIMVDVSGKDKTHREAIASGRICVSEAVYAAITAGTAKKGDVLGVARICLYIILRNIASNPSHASRSFFCCSSSAVMGFFGT